MANGTDTPQTNAFEGQGEQLLGRPTPPPASAAPTTPGMGVAPQPEQTTAAAPPAATLQPPAAAPRQITPEDVTAHHTWLGHVAKSLNDTVHGVETVYKVHPETGEMETSQVTKGPGSFFKKLVAGMLIGGMAGSERPEQGFMGGFARGGGAAVAVEEKREEAKRTHAGEDFERQQRFIKQKADLAHANHQDLLALNYFDQAQKQQLDRSNEIHESTRRLAEQAGGFTPKIAVGGQDINGQQGNGRALMQHHIDTKELDKSPEGYHRVHTMKTDYSGLTRKFGDDGVYWVDKDGKYVDLALDRTTHTFYDVAINDWEKPRKFNGAELSKILGVNVYLADKDYNLAPKDVFGGSVKERELNAKGILAGAAAERADAAQDRARAAQERFDSSDKRNNIAGMRDSLKDVDANITLLYKYRDQALSAQDKAAFDPKIADEEKRRRQMQSRLDELTGATPPVSAADLDHIVKTFADMDDKTFAKNVKDPQLHLTPEQQQEAIESHRALNVPKPVASHKPAVAPQQPVVPPSQPTAPSVAPTQRDNDR